MKKSIAIVLALSLVAPMAQAKGKLLKKMIIIGGVAYAANAIAKNHQKQDSQMPYSNQSYYPQYGNQYPNQYPNNQNYNTQYQQYPQQPQGYYNQVPQSPSYFRY